MAMINSTNSSGMPTLSYYMQDTVWGLLRETTINNTGATAGDSNIFQIVINLGNFPSRVRRHIYTVTSMCLFVTRLGLGFWKLFHNWQAKFCPNQNMVDMSQHEHCLENEDSGIHTNWFRQSINGCCLRGTWAKVKGILCSWGPVTCNSFIFLGYGVLFSR